MVPIYELVSGRQLHLQHTIRPYRFITDVIGYIDFLSL